MARRLADGLQVDMRVGTAESFGAALQYFTGSKDHNIILRGRAQDSGLKINEYGVFLVHRTTGKLFARRPEARAARSQAGSPRSGRVPR